MARQREYPQPVQIIEGIGTEVLGDEDARFPIALYSGEASYCERGADDGCSNDGLLWGDTDSNSPLLCTEHFFQAEKNGFTFVPVA